MEAGIRLNPGKAKIWNSAGVKPPGCKILQRVAETFDPTAVIGEGQVRVAHTATGDESKCWGPLWATQSS